MSDFDRLHPALQHHIVNSLGWRELRPLQELSIGPILDGKHALLLAPTAGGKTESAIFPVLSRMLSENWSGLSVLYVCPLKALLNNLHVRLERYCALVGRTCGLWHGDIEQARRQRVLRDAPDILLTTPESLEAMLVSRRVEHRELFQNLRVVVVDEIHAFAGDDRGWHLLAVLERITRLTMGEPQRIGLSATVGNPRELVDWLAGHCRGERTTVIAAANGAETPDVQVDFVGNLDNAAVVVSRLHRGEKRLVFCDSRSRVEELGVRLRELGVETYLSHSSLSVEERRRAEAAFSQATNCVIVATSTLELGIDVGDLDRVIQIDAPGKVASFLQRLGRTGRRAGLHRNCLFLATSQEALHRAIALVSLWQDGYVEPVKPPPLPLHLLAQQILALVLQEGGIGRHSWQPWVLRLPPFAELAEADRDAIVAHLLKRGVLHEDQGILSIGVKGEADYGYRYFSELLSVFTTSPVFTVLHGQQEIGTVDQANFLVRGQGPGILALGGRCWRVMHVDWKRHRAHVEPEPVGGKTRWFGGAPALGFTLCQRMQRVVTDATTPTFLSRRGIEALAELRGEFDWVRPGVTCVRPGGGSGGSEWWTFGGQSVNQVLAAVLERRSHGTTSADSLAIGIDLGPATAVEFIRSMQGLAPEEFVPTLDEDSEKAMKFAELLPKHLRERVLQARLVQVEDITEVIGQKVVAVSASTEASGVG